MKQGLASVRRMAGWITIGVMVMTWAGCDDDAGTDNTPEPVVYNFKYLSVELTAPIEGKEIAEITLNADDLKTYTFALSQTGSKRVACSATTFLDADDELLSQNALTLSFKTDADNVFDVVDGNGNIARFTPVTTGATSLIIHMAGAILTDEERAAYIAVVTKQVNFMQNQVYEIQ